MDTIGRLLRNSAGARVRTGDSMSDELWRMSAVEAVARLRNGEISPLELVDASAQRIAEVEPTVNALPTLCLDRAREHARRIMQGGAACEATGEAGWLPGPPGLAK